MKKKNFFAVVTATLMSMASYGQYSLDYKPTNGQGKILLTSTIKNMPAQSKGIRMIEVSNNPSMIPVIDGKQDSVFSNGPASFKDTFTVSVSYPIWYYVSETVITKDTAGNIDTAKATKILPVLVTPNFIKPTQALFKLIVSQTTATISGNFTSGFDSVANIEVTVSYGDTLYLNPSVKYPYKQKVYVKPGSNQNNTLSFSIPLNTPDYPFSYRVKISNSIGDTLSPIFKGKTLDQPGPATVSSPYNITTWSDSIVFYDETIATGIATKHVSYIATSTTAKPFDSVIVMIAAGQADGIVLRNSFRGLTPLTDYYVWSTVKNSMNVSPHTSNRILAQTGQQMITVFKLTVDSTASSNFNTENIYIGYEIPSGKSAHIVVLGRVWPSGQTIVLADFVAQSNQRNSIIPFTPCLQGQIYQVSPYGSDEDHTNDVDAWQVQDTFTFTPNYTASVTKVEKEKLLVYPNPAKDWIYSNQPIALFNSLGEKVAEGDGKIFIDHLPKGFYYYGALRTNSYSGKILKE